jgi:hypothetical protein
LVANIDRSGVGLMDGCLALLATIFSTRITATTLSVRSKKKLMRIILPRDARSCLLSGMNFKIRSDG